MVVAQAKGWLQSLIRMVLLLLTASGIMLTAGCASGPPKIGGDPRLEVLPDRSLPAPRGEVVALGDPSFHIGPMDRLAIQVYGMPELSVADTQVDAGGNVSVPLVGTMRVAGLKPADVEQRVAQRLQAAHVREPMVSVNVRETLSRNVTIEGQVKKPGLYPVRDQMTLLKTIAQAEGTLEFTRLDDVVIYRTVEGQRYAALYDISAIRRGVYEDPLVYPNDVITVGDSRSRRLFRDVLMVLPAAITPIIIGLDRLSN